MKFFVKHPQRAGLVFLSDKYIGLASDPIFAAKADALEAYYEPYAKHEWGEKKSFPKPAPVISLHGDVTRIQPPE